MCRTMGMWHVSLGAETSDAMLIVTCTVLDTRSGLRERRGLSQAGSGA
jgi:hypothetical protein